MLWHQQATFCSFLYFLCHMLVCVLRVSKILTLGRIKCIKNHYHYLISSYTTTFSSNAKFMNQSKRSERQKLSSKKSITTPWIGKLAHAFVATKLIHLPSHHCSAGKFSTNLVLELEDQEVKFQRPPLLRHRKQKPEPILSIVAISPTNF